MFHALAIYDPLDDSREPIPFGRLYGEGERDQEQLRRDLLEARRALERRPDLSFIVATHRMEARLGVNP